MRYLIILIFTVPPVYADSLVRNGSFQNGMDHWVQVESASGTSIIADAGRPHVLRLDSRSGANYEIEYEQWITPDQPYTHYQYDVDWKVTSKEPNWGTLSIALQFFDANAVEIGYIALIDQSYHNSFQIGWAHGLPEDSYHILWRYYATFDWEHQSFDTRTVLPGMDHSAVDQIYIKLRSYNDAGRGGTLLIDDIALTGEGSSPIPAPLAIGSGMVLFLSWAVRRSRRYGI